MTKPKEQQFSSEQQVSIVIEPDGSNDGIIVKWDRPTRKKSWSLPGAVPVINRLAQALRTDLLKIKDVYTTGDPTKEYEETLVPALKQLAQHGERLNSYLFNSDRASDIKAWLNKQEEKGLRAL